MSENYRELPFFTKVLKDNVEFALINSKGNF